MYEHFLLLSSKYSLSDGKHSYIEKWGSYTCCGIFCKRWLRWTEKKFCPKNSHSCLYIHIRCGKQII